MNENDVIRNQISAQQMIGGMEKSEVTKCSSDATSGVPVLSESTMCLLQERALKLGKTIEAYILGLVSKEEEFCWPKVDFNKLDSREVSKYSGIVKISELPQNDEQFMRIWNC